MVKIGKTTKVVVGPYFIPWHFRTRTERHLQVDYYYYCEHLSTTDNPMRWLMHLLRRRRCQHRILMLCHFPSLYFHWVQYWRLTITMHVEKISTALGGNKTGTRKAIDEKPIDCISWSKIAVPEAFDTIGCVIDWWEGDVLYWGTWCWETYSKVDFRVRRVEDGIESSNYTFTHILLRQSFVLPETLCRYIFCFPVTELRTLRYKVFKSLITNDTFDSSLIHKGLD